MLVLHHRYTSVKGCHLIMVGAFQLSYYFGSGVTVMRSQARPVSGFTLMRGSIRQRSADSKQTTAKHTGFTYFQNSPSPQSNVQSMWPSADTKPMLTTISAGQSLGYTKVVTERLRKAWSRWPDIAKHCILPKPAKVSEYDCLTCSTGHHATW